jgi:hypothetical protein
VLSSQKAEGEVACGSGNCLIAKAGDVCALI